jgi:uncharacterized protein YbaA (DUF1428 family)
MNNKTTTEFTSEIEEEGSGSYLQISFSQAPKKNHDALAQLGKRFEQWLKEYGVSSKIYYLNNSSSKTSEEVQRESLESITKTLFLSHDEELLVSLQFYKDKAHADQVRSKMMQDETFRAIAKEFDSLVTQGKSMITDGFSRLGV